MIERERISKAEQFTKPGTANVSPADLEKLRPLIAHYRKSPHPFRACYRDQIKHGLTPGHAARRCAVIKDLMMGTTSWRKGSQSGLKKDLGGFDQLEAEDEIEKAWNEAAHPRNDRGVPGGGRFRKKDRSEHKGDKGDKGGDAPGKDLIDAEDSGRLASAIEKLIPGTGNLEARIRMYQRRKGLEVDGIVGAQTAAALLGEEAADPGVLDDATKDALRAKAGKKPDTGDGRVRTGGRRKKDRPDKGRGRVRISKAVDLELSQQELFDIEEALEQLGGETWNTTVRTMAAQESRSTLRDEIIGNITKAAGNAKQARWPKGTPGIGGQRRPTGMPDSSALLAGKALGGLGESEEHRQLAKNFNVEAKKVDWSKEKDPDGKVRDLLSTHVVRPLRQGIRPSEADEVSGRLDSAGRDSDSGKTEHLPDEVKALWAGSASDSQLEAAKRKLSKENNGIANSQSDALSSRSNKRLASIQRQLRIISAEQDRRGTKGQKDTDPSKLNLDDARAEARALADERRRVRGRSRKATFEKLRAFDRSSKGKRLKALDEQISKLLRESKRR